MSLADDIRQVEQLKCSALRERYRQVLGIETRSNNRPYLIKSIVKGLKERRPTSPPPSTQPTEEVDEPKKSTATTAKNTTPGARVQLRPKADERSTRKRDPRLPKVGSTIEKDHDGKTIKVEVLEDGFRYKGDEYRSLSAIAKEVTGTVWNGFLYFGLTTPAERKAEKKKDSAVKASA